MANEQTPEAIAAELWNNLNTTEKGDDTSILREKIPECDRDDIASDPDFLDAIENLYSNELEALKGKSGDLTENLALYVEELAFFGTAKPAKPDPEDSEDDDKKRKSNATRFMSVNVSSIKRVATTDPTTYDVYFETFDMNNLRKDPLKLKERNRKLDALIKAFTDMFRRTFVTETPDFRVRNEIGQLSWLFHLFNHDVFPMFQTRYKVKQRGDPDFVIKRTNSEETYVIGEGKDVNMFPLDPSPSGIRSAANLCWFGFATAVMKRITDKTTYGKVQKALRLDEKNEFAQPKNPGNDANTSDLAKCLCKIEHDGRSENDKISDDDIEVDFGVADGNWREQLSTRIQSTAIKLRQEMMNGNSDLHPKDALHLWDATMQVCSACWTRRRKLGIVMSTRVMFFVRLDMRGNNDERKCFIQISNGTRIFSKGFFKYFLRFIQHSLSREEKYSMWEGWGRCPFGTNKKIGGNDDKGANGESKQDESRGNSDGDSTHQSGRGSKKRSTPDDGNSNDSQQPGGNGAPSHNGHEDNCTLSLTRMVRVVTSGSKKGCQGLATSDESKNKENNIVSPGPFYPDLTNSGSADDPDPQSKNMKESMIMTDEEQMAWQRAFVGGKTSHYDEAYRMPYLDIDTSGVITPYICHLEDVVEPLGNGRCGMVKKIKWRGGYAALKRFELADPDDDRCPLDVCEREVETYCALESLWGKHVPRLLFKCPWSWYPAIGVEVGEPMADNYKEWSSADLEKKEKTDTAIKSLGYVQMDGRGANYVRLANGEIAMIDFEDVKEIKK